MTTEERFVKIENTLEMVSENLARHEAAIRDLIVVSRTLLESQKENVESQRRLQETQQRDHDAWQEAQRELDRTFAELKEQGAETDKRLNALLQIVDEIIRRRKNGGS